MLEVTHTKVRMQVDGDHRGVALPFLLEFLRLHPADALSRISSCLNAPPNLHLAGQSARTSAARPSLRSFHKIVPCPLGEGAAQKPSTEYCLFLDSVSAHVLRGDLTNSA